MPRQATRFQHNGDDLRRHRRHQKPAIAVKRHRPDIRRRHGWRYRFGVIVRMLWGVSIAAMNGSCSLSARTVFLAETISYRGEKQ